MAFKQGQSLIQMGGIQFGQQYQTYRSIPKYLRHNPNVYWVPNRVTPLPRINPQTMIDYFKQNMNFSHYTEYVARAMLRKFAEVAARYSPPNIGKATIENRFYFRPIYNLVELAKGLCRTDKGKVLHATKEDYAALRNGFKFKVVSTKYRDKKGRVVAYTKGINEAKRASRIENRGLTKYSWGSILNTFNGQNIGRLVSQYKEEGAKTRFGVENQNQPGQFLERRILVQTDMPVMFKRLQNKSPNIVKYRWGNVDWQQTEKPMNIIKFYITNNLAEVERYCDTAIRRGINESVKEVNRLVKYIQDGAKDKIERMFNFDIYKVTKITAVHITTPNEANKFKGRKSK